MPLWHSSTIKILNLGNLIRLITRNSRELMLLLMLKFVYSLHAVILLTYMLDNALKH